MPATDRPDADVIDDDTALDAWYERFTREQERKSGKPGDARYSLLGASPDSQPNMQFFGG